MKLIKMERSAWLYLKLEHLFFSLTNTKPTAFAVGLFLSATRYNRAEAGFYNSTHPLIKGSKSLGQIVSLLYTVSLNIAFSISIQSIFAPDKFAFVKFEKSILAPFRLLPEVLHY